MSIEFLAVSIFFLVVNLISFNEMYVDKVKARLRSDNRIPEGVLFFMAVFFGSVGVYLGMFAFRHKTQRWYFVIGMPLLMLENLAFLYFVFKYLVGLHIIIT